MADQSRPYSTMLSSLPKSHKALVAQTYPGTPVVVERPTPTEADLAEGQMIVKVHAVAVNPVDAMLTRVPWSFLKTMPFSVKLPEEPVPLVLGGDMSGEVVAIGPGVTTFAIGDRILAAGKTADNNCQTFQQYAVTLAKYTSKMPSTMNFDAAATILLTFKTVATGMFLGSGIAPPWQGGAGKEAGNGILVFGGSTSVGQYAKHIVLVSFLLLRKFTVHVFTLKYSGIQLAKLAGFSAIITTASSQHADYLKSLGATHVVNHNTSAEEYTSLASSTSHPITAAVLAITTEEYLVTALAVLPPKTGKLIISMPQLASRAMELGAPYGITPSIMAASPYSDRTKNFIADANAALSGYLADGSIVPNRVQLVLGGLSGIPEAMNLLSEKKVSGVKLVARPFETV
ncbi:GroES-like protein [Clavulina sp. PMI_390]|nr:GroES-like protein [Clavulina sp. PMI_390]